jgi:hypothetical protein
MALEGAPITSARRRGDSGSGAKRHFPAGMKFGQVRKRLICVRQQTGTRQLLQQRLRLLPIARVEPFGEPAVDRSQGFARFLHLALVAPEARKAHGGAEFPGFGLLLACDREGLLEIGCRRQHAIALAAALPFIF